MEQKDNLALERDIAKRLHAIGTPADLRGYHYLIETIKIAIADKEAVFEMTKNIYEPVAKQFNVTAKQVSKAITRAILTAWIGATWIRCRVTLAIPFPTRWDTY